MRRPRKRVCLSGLFGVLGFLVSPPGVAIAEDVDELGDPTETIDAIGPIPSYQRPEGFDTMDATFTLRIELVEKVDGEREVIFESGGGTVGLSVVYEAPSALVLRVSGNGGFSLGVLRFPLPDHLIGTELDLAWTFDVDDLGLQTLAILVNDVRVALLTKALQADWSGSNDAALGVQDSTVAANGQNGGIPAVDFTSGTINLDEGLRFYADANYIPEGTDSDGDGIADEWEEVYFPGQLDQLGDGDRDGDGLGDAEEFEFLTDPTSPDTERDGLSDDEEIAAATEPRNPDTDNDGLDDIVELGGDPVTDPTNADTDGDGFSDRTEVARGSDPTDAGSLPVDCTPDLGEPTEDAITVLGQYPDYQRDGYDTRDVTFTAVVDFEPKLDGERELIWETGGGTVGFSLVYEAVNTLVLRSAGNGGFSLATVRYQLPDELIDEGELDLAWAYDVDDGQGLQTIALFVGGVEVRSMTMDLGGDWSGSNDASFGTRTSGVAGTGENGTISATDFVSGTIDLDEGLGFYSDVFFCPDATDSDGDGLADEWETLFSPGDLGRLGEGDADGDGLADAEELALGTHPLNEDSDDDGLSDGAEVASETDPLVADSDGDGRTDGDEVSGDPTSDPLNPDSDGDGFPDGPEVASGTDPNDAGSLPPPECDAEPDNLIEVVDILGPLPSYDSRLPLDPFDPDPANLDQRDATFIASVDFDPKTGGEREVIWETGGGTTGFSLVYEATSTLVLRANGSGGLVLVTVSYELPQELIAGGDVTVAWTYDVEHAGLSTIGLIVNDAIVGSASGALGGDWSGTNNAAFGVADTGFAGTGDNNDLTGVDFTSGTISLDFGLEFYSEVVWCPGGDEPPTPSLKPGDVNADGSLNIADMVAQLNFLFGGGALPACYVVPDSDPVALNTTGLAVLDYNGDGSSNIADAVGGLGGLFGGGAPHVLGEGCASIEGACGSNCVR